MTTTATPQRRVADVAVIGAGFAGALTAMALRACGRSVVLIDRGRHPRVVIGESSTPLANLLLEELATRYGLAEVTPFTRWGRWQRERPDVPCGLKRGFSFFFHREDEPFTDDDGHARQLLVGASPNDEVADTHWYRQAFDAELVTQAQRRGVAYVDDVALEQCEEGPTHVTLRGVRGTMPFEVEAAVVVDASGPRGCLARLLDLGEAPLRWLPPTQGLYAHFTGVHTWEATHPPAAGQAPPYPVDAAAVHHVFPGGWIWVLRFDNGITSAGTALLEADARALSLDEGQAAWQRLLARLPAVAAQFRDAHACTPFTHLPRVAYRCAQVSGARWTLLPSAAGVIDPLLSTGFPLTLLGIHRVVEAIDTHWAQPSLRGALGAHAEVTQRELDATEHLVAALYACLDDPLLFKRLTLLYFAAASYSETARRLGRHARARGFLLCDDARFGPACAGCADAVRLRSRNADRAALLSAIDAVVAPWDVAGLGDRGRRDWYPAQFEDVYAAREKLDATVEEIDALVAVAGRA